MRIPVQNKMLDQILQEYHTTRIDPDYGYGLPIFESIFTRLVGNFAEDGTPYLTKLEDDGYLTVKESPYRNGSEELMSHACHITETGVEFLELGGYEHQFSTEQHKLASDNALRIREIEAAEKGTQAAKDSARSSNYSALFAGVAILVTVALAVFQHYQSKQEGDKIDPIERRIDSLSNRIDSLQIQTNVYKARLLSQSPMIKQPPRVGIHSVRTEANMPHRRK